MINPPIDDLLKKVDCRYTLVVATSRRARFLIDSGEPLQENPITQAAQEIYDDNLTYKKHYE